MKDLAAALQQLKDASLYRRRRIIDGPQGAHLSVAGRQLLSFCSNDYLGLANHPEVNAAFVRGVQRWGSGSGASHLVNGHSRAHHALEEELADFCQRPRALLFSTGYMANMGSIAALLGRHDTIFHDRLNHASLLDGGQLAQARLQRYPHNDIDSLKHKLAACTQGEKLIVSDGVFSMDGDLADLPALVDTARQQDAWLMIDDAHGFGMLGEQGGGCCEHFGLNHQDVPILVGTLGKAFGSFGAFVTGDEDLIEYLIQKARPYIYTTALPPAVAEASRASLRLLREEGWRRDKLKQLIQRFRNGAKQLGLRLMSSDTAIQPLLIGDNQRAMQISEALLADGILISAIRPPTVAKGTARLRITLSAAHDEADIDRLLSALETL